MTSLLEAIQYGDVSEVCVLLEGKADVNAAEEYGWTSLMCASMYGYESVVDLLVKAKADVNAAKENGRTRQGVR